MHLLSPIPIRWAPTTHQSHRGHCEDVRWSMKGTESFLSKHTIIEKCLCDFCRSTCISHYPGSPHCLPRVSVSFLPSVLKQFPLFPASVKSHRTFCTFNWFNTFIQHMFTKHLLYTRPCFKPWRCSKKVTKDPCPPGADTLAWENDSKLTDKKIIYW